MKSVEWWHFFNWKTHSSKELRVTRHCVCSLSFFLFFFCFLAHRAGQVIWELGLKAGVDSSLPAFPYTFHMTLDTLFIVGFFIYLVNIMTCNSAIMKIGRLITAYVNAQYLIIISLIHNWGSWWYCFCYNVWVVLDLLQLVGAAGFDPMIFLETCYILVCKDKQNLKHCLFISSTNVY